METGKFNTVIGTLPPGSKLGDGNTIINAADANGNVIVNTPIAVGYGAKADKTSIAIGAFANAGGIESLAEDIQKKEPEPAPDHWYKKPIGVIGIAIVSGTLLFLAVSIIKLYLGIS